MEKYQTHGDSLSKSGINVSALIEKLTKISQIPELRKLIEILGTEAELHLVGGIIRDLAQERKNFDLDLATKLLPDQLRKLLTSRDIKVIPTGIEHGTLTVIINDYNLEITTFRKPGSRNSGSFSQSILEDLAGRDFTFNAMAFNLEKFEFLDPHNGIADLNRKQIKCVGDPRTRFIEDPLRILRLIRIGTAQGFSIDSDTRKSACELAHTINDVSIERVRTELEKILLAPAVAESFREMQKIGLLRQILPELENCLGVEQNDFHIHDVFEHTLWVLERSQPELTLRLACLFHDLGKPGTLSVDEQGRRHFYKHELESERICLEVMPRFTFSKEQTRNVANLVRNHMRPLVCGAGAVRRIMRDTGELFDLWLEIKKADAPPKQPQDDFERDLNNFLELKNKEDIRVIQSQRSGLAINGTDLIKIGFKRNRKLGEVLKSLENAILENPECNTPESLLALAKQLL